MNLTVALAAATIGLAAPLSVLAQSSTEAVGAVNEDVLAATSANIQGEAIAYPTGTPEISSWTITFEKGGHSSLHQHPVPLYVYVLEGELEVRPEGGADLQALQPQALVYQTTGFAAVDCNRRSSQSRAPRCLVLQPAARAHPHLALRRARRLILTSPTVSDRLMDRLDLLCPLLRPPLWSRTGPACAAWYLPVSKTSPAPSNIGVSRRAQGNPQSGAGSS